MLIPFEKALIEYPVIHLSEQQTQDLIHGKQVKCDQADELYVMLDQQNLFLGIGQVDGGQLRVKNIFMKSYQQRLSRLS